MNACLVFSLLIACYVVFGVVLPEGVAKDWRKKSAPMPNFLIGDTIPEDYDHDWNLRPTGAAVGFTPKITKPLTPARSSSQKLIEALQPTEF